MSSRDHGADLFMAKQSFVVTLDNEILSVKRGDLVRAGHPLLRGRAGLFEPAHNYVRFDVEAATAAPGQRR